LSVTLAEDPHEAENLDLQEGVRDAGNVVLGTVVGSYECFEVSDEKRYGLRNDQIVSLK
jgi:hypothetical protein